MLLHTHALLAGILSSGGLPQVPHADHAYFEADAIDGAIDGVVVCRVDVAGERGWDTFSAIDLAVTLGAGDQRAELWGPEDRSSGFVSAPGFRIAVGTRVTVIVEDRDATGRELVARGATVFAGNGLAFDLDDTQVVCRTVPRARAQLRAATPMNRAHSAVARLKNSVVDLRAHGLGYDSLAAFDVDLALAEAAAWVGPTAEQQAVREARDAARRAHAVRAGAAVRAFPPTTFASDARVEVALTDAGVEIAARAAQTGGLAVDVVDVDGHVHFVDTLRLALQPGTTVAVPLDAGGGVVRVSVAGQPPLLLKRG